MVIASCMFEQSNNESEPEGEKKNQLFTFAMQKFSQFHKLVKVTLAYAALQDYRHATPPKKTAIFNSKGVRTASARSECDSS